MDEINQTAVRLVYLTLLSFYIIAAYACWMPFLKSVPRRLQLFAQFIFIAIPQSMIVILPEYAIKQYVYFTAFAACGLFFSFIRYSLVKKRLEAEQFDIEKDTNHLLAKETLERAFNTVPANCPRSNTISCYQTCIMMMTVTAISAVDFKAFPPEFRKTKTFGLSLMDIGVALIISSSGLVMGKYLHGPSKITFIKLAKSTYPLFIIAAVRAVFGEYKIGADEYGRHWSFFLNLAILPYTLLLWKLLPSPHLVPFVCVFLMFGYENALMFKGYKDYILQANTFSLFEANKVGIFSLLGYCNLFSLTCYIGRFFQNRKSQFKSSFGVIGALCVTSWLLFFFMSKNYPPSRPLANSSYVLWAFANGSLHALLLVVYDKIFPESFRFLVFPDMVSDYRLSIFIIANVLSQGIKKYFTVNSTSKAYLAGVVTLYMSATFLITSIRYYLGTNFMNNKN